MYHKHQIQIGNISDPSKYENMQCITFFMVVLFSIDKHKIKSHLAVGSAMS